MGQAPHRERRDRHDRSRPCQDQVLVGHEVPLLEEGPCDEEDSGIEPRHPKVGLSRTGESKCCTQKFLVGI